MAQRVRQAVEVVSSMAWASIGRSIPSTSSSAPPSTPWGIYGRLLLPAGRRDRLVRVPPLSRSPALRGWQEKRAQTEFFGYHSAYKMQGNRLEDLWPTFRRFILLFPWIVPAGLRVVWAIFWAVVIVVAVFVVNLASDGFDFTQLTIDNVVRGVLGGGLIAIIVGLLLTYILTRFMPRWITSSFVDVARYLDTSPRCVRSASGHPRRHGRLLRGCTTPRLRGKPRYQRIIVVGHSLGTSSDTTPITYLGARSNELHRPPMDIDEKASGADGGSVLASLEELEKAAAQVGPNGKGLDAYRDAQRTAWQGLRLEGDPWRITDFLSFGSPMYFADRLMTLNPAQFQQRKDRRDFPTCPPQPDEGAKAEGDRIRLSYNNGGRRVLYHGAPFGVVRWTNLWFPPHLWFFGDWFSGALAPLFRATASRTFRLRGNRPASLAPAVAHALYFSFSTTRRPIVHDTSSASTWTSRAATG